MNKILGYLDDMKGNPQLLLIGKSMYDKGIVLNLQTGQVSHILPVMSHLNRVPFEKYDPSMRKHIFNYITRSPDILEKYNRIIHDDSFSSL